MLCAAGWKSLASGMLDVSISCAMCSCRFRHIGPVCKYAAESNSTTQRSTKPESGFLWGIAFSLLATAGSGRAPVEVEVEHTTTTAAIMDLELELELELGLELGLELDHGTGTGSGTGSGTGAEPGAAKRNFQSIHLTEYRAGRVYAEPARNT